jgi:predicted nucleic acid-binding protein
LILSAQIATVTVKVADASAAAAIRFNEPTADIAIARFAGADLIAPELILCELANICATRLRKKAAMLADTLDGLAEFSGIGITLFEIDPADIVRTAAASGLTGYDASYLWLVHQHDAELVTFDKRFAAAASR